MYKVLMEEMSEISYFLDSCSSGHIFLEFGDMHHFYSKSEALSQNPSLLHSSSSSIFFNSSDMGIVAFHSVKSSLSELSLSSCAGVESI
jgi:hypothetical protein